MLVCEIGGAHQGLSLLHHHHLKILQQGLAQTTTLSLTCRGAVRIESPASVIDLVSEMMMTTTIIVAQLAGLLHEQTPDHRADLTMTAQDQDDMMMTIEDIAPIMLLVDEVRTMAVITTGILLTAAVMKDIGLTMDLEARDHAADTMTREMIAETATGMIDMMNHGVAVIEMTVEGEEEEVDMMNTTGLTNTVDLAAPVAAKRSSTGRSKPLLCS